MALEPVLKSKVDELFLRWVSDPTTQKVLRINLREILKGENALTPQPPLLVPRISISPAHNNNISKTQLSPRGRNSSPLTPPCSPTIGKSASPRSPRRGLAGRLLNRQLNNTTKSTKEKEVTNKERETTPVKHIDNDNDGNKFLRQKEAELREKRERERHKGGEEVRRIEVGQGETKETNLTLRVSNDHAPLKPAKKAETSTSIILQQQQHQQHRPQTVPQQQRSQRQLFKKPAPQPPELSPQSVKIPPFYFPMGEPVSGLEKSQGVDRLKEVFSKIEAGKAARHHMADITKALGAPLYWKRPIFQYSGGEKNGHVTSQQLLAAWKRLNTTCYDDASRLVRLMAKSGRNWLQEEDFVPFIQDIVDSHPGLSFLQDAPEFHSRYVHTVISRIFYCVNRSWTGRMTIPELRRSNLISTVQLLEVEEDINQVSDFFSYEHFYVIYCKFWELDQDHDLYISKDDLARHNEHAISSRMIDRIFSGAVTRNLQEGKMSYRDFVWFLMSEEDKRHPTSIEYWFRCMDLDGDGVISMYEMEYFYEEQVQKMEALGIETLPFEDCLCQMLDMVKPAEEGRITLRDLKSCKLTPVFFDTFFNLDKYLEHEQKDPFANSRDGEDVEELSDWEKYAAEEYEILVAEEGATEAQQEDISYEDDFEGEDEELSNLAEALQLDTDVPLKKGSKRVTGSKDDMFCLGKSDLS